MHARNNNINVYTADCMGFHEPLLVSLGLLSLVVESVAWTFPSSPLLWPFLLAGPSLFDLSHSWSLPLQREN